MKVNKSKMVNGRYINPHITDVRRRTKDFLLWALGFFRDHPFDLVPEGFFYPLPSCECDPEKPWAMWIGHSTYLVSIGGVHFLTDPVWSRRSSPLPFLGPKRQIPPPVKISQLPKIDYVLISHDHYDHLDRKSVERLHRRFPDILWIVPKGVKKWFKKQGISKVVELDWWEEAHIDSILRITSVPSQHFSGRAATNGNRTLWCGYVVEDLRSSKVLYFVGDTGYNPYDFKAIGERFPKIDLSLIPIGSYSPRKFMSTVHIEPRDAVNIHKDVGSQFSLAMHWKTFRLSEEPMEQPPFDLLKALHHEKIDPSNFLAPDPGQKFNW